MRRTAIAIADSLTQPLFRFFEVAAESLDPRDFFESHPVKFLAFVPLARGSTTHLALEWYQVIDIVAMVIVVSVVGLHVPAKWHLEQGSEARVLLRRSTGPDRLLPV